MRKTADPSNIQMLFRFENVAKEFAGSRVLSEVTLQLNPSDHIGLIGRNGCGKTTLLRLAAGVLQPDEGVVYRAGGLRISQVEQNPALADDRSLKLEALQALNDLNRMENRLRELEGEISQSGRHIRADLAAEYEKLKTRFELEGGYDREARAEAVLHGVGFDAADLDHNCRELSGGQISRLALAKVLLRPADLLLLDEPTNHLDIKGVLWLTTYLAKLRNAYVVVSHDRRFLDEVTTSTWEIDGGRLFSFPGNFSKSRKLKEAVSERRQREFRSQQEWKARAEEFVRRNIAGQKTRQARSRLKQLERTRWLEGPAREALGPAISVREAGRGAAVSLRLMGLTVGYESRELIRDISLEIRRGDRIAVMGPNASGKSTFLRTLTGELAPRKGTLEWSQHCVPAYFSQNPDLGPLGRTVFDCLRDLDARCSDEEIRSFAARFLFKGEDVFKQIGQLSGGEASRLALARLLFHPANVLLLDEPTNHLDILGREALEEALQDFGGTLLVVSHDLYFVERITTRMMWIQDKRFVAAASIPEILELASGTDSSDQRAEPARVSPKAKLPKSPSRPTLSKNERMRRRRQLVDLETQIQTLEIEKKDLLENLSDEPDYGALRQLSIRYETVEKELESLYRSWELAFEELGG